MNKQIEILDYHDRPEWSYSSMKLILDSGIDYAVGSRKGLTPRPDSSAIDLGQLAHMIVLGGEDTFALSPYPDFRKKEAREWRAKQLELGKNIISQKMFDDATEMVANIENHPHSKDLLLNKNAKFEQEMFATTVNGVRLRGKADSIVLDKDSAIVTDLKTTGMFDKFARNAYWSHLDLQAAVYTLIAASHLKIPTNAIKYYWCVVEAVKPYRVQYMEAVLEFIDSGERKLSICIDEIIKFGDKEPNFLLEEIKEVGDMSL